MTVEAGKHAIPATIRKEACPSAVSPNLTDYEREYREFRWEKAARLLSGLLRGLGVNIAHEAVDRHAASSRAVHLALRWIGKDGTRRDFTYADLRSLTNRFANVLQKLGVVRWASCSRWCALRANPPAVSSGASISSTRCRARGCCSCTRSAAQAAKAAPEREPAQADWRSRMRNAIAAAMSRSKREIPHYYLSTDIDVTQAMDWLATESLRRGVT
jgi:hypothetical protein